VTETDPIEERAPALIRYGLPFGAVILFLGLVTAAAFTGTARWSIAIPIGLVIGGLALTALRLIMRRRGIAITAWLDDYWTRED
jgi:uncharacterized membrane protein